MQNNVNELLKFNANFSDIDNINEICAQFTCFLTDQFETTNSIVYSFSSHRIKSATGSGTNHKRTVWNQENINVDNIEYDKLIKKLFINNNEIEYEKINEENLIKHAIRLIGLESQVYYLFFETTKPIKEDFITCLSGVFDNLSKMYVKFQKMNSLEDLVYKDEISGLSNQRKLSKDLDSLIERYNIYKEKFSVLFIDIDHFKQINDGHGHLVGTELLSEVSTLIKSFLRDTDYCYRYGGDEFVVILPKSDETNASIIGERILQGIKSHNIMIDEVSKTNKVTSHNFQISVSIGISHFPKDATDKKQVLNIADKMMYEAKKGGRGKVFSTSAVIDLVSGSKQC